MLKKVKDMRKNKKGFTLVELIVVLVILAILIALLVPALTGYIAKANEKKVQVEARQMLVAIQTTESEATNEASYAGKPDTTKPSEAIWKLSELSKTEPTDGRTCTYGTDGEGKVTALVYYNNKYTATYVPESTSFTVKKGK